MSQQPRDNKKKLLFAMEKTVISVIFKSSNRNNFIALLKIVLPRFINRLPLEVP